MEEKAERVDISGVVGIGHMIITDNREITDKVCFGSFVFGVAGCQLISCKFWLLIDQYT